MRGIIERLKRLLGLFSIPGWFLLVWGFISTVSTLDYLRTTGTKMLSAGRVYMTAHPNVRLFIGLVWLTLIVVGPDVYRRLRVRFPSIFKERPKTLAERLKSLENTVQARLGRIEEQITQIPGFTTYLVGLISLAQEAEENIALFLEFQLNNSNSPVAQTPFTRLSGDEKANNDREIWISHLERHFRHIHQLFTDNWHIPVPLQLKGELETSVLTRKIRDRETSANECLNLLNLHHSELCKLRDNQAARFSEPASAISTTSASVQTR